MNKEVKAALRQIKGLLKVQQYEEAVEACQVVINSRYIVIVPSIGPWLLEDLLP